VCASFGFAIPMASAWFFLRRVTTDGGDTPTRAHQ
jgi:hypothetical protein